MWEKTFVLLLHAMEAAVASQCWQGATFPEAVVSLAVQSRGLLPVPGVASLSQCVAACCSLPGYDLAWLFQGRCYILSCQQRDDCKPHQRPGADSVLAFLRRASPQRLVLHSLVRGEPYGGRWRTPSRSSEAPGDLEALKDLALFDGAGQDLSDLGTLDPDYSEGSPEEQGHQSETMARQGAEIFNQSLAEEEPEGGTTETGMAQRASSVGTVAEGNQGGTERPTDAALTSETQSNTPSVSLSPSPWQPATSATQNNRRTSWVPTPTALPSTIPTQPGRALLVSLGNIAGQTPPTFPPVTPEWSVSPEPSTEPDAVKQTAPTPQSLVQTPTLERRTSSHSTTTTAATATTTSVSDMGVSNRSPLAIVGPDRKLTLPVSSLLLDGSGSTDDHAIISYHWDAISGPPGVKLEKADQAVATAKGLRVGRYTFRLTVSDQEGATSSALLTVRIQEARSLPPVAHASGSHTLTLPNNSLVLHGSVTDGDQSEVHYLWVRDSQSPAAGDVLYNSDSQASLYLSNLVEGTYLFQLRVTDAQGRSNSATATVEVRPEPGGGQEVELEMLVSVSQVSVAQRDTVVRQLAALLHVLDGDIQVRALQGHSHLSSVLRFSVRGPSGPVPASRLVGLLRNQLLREKSDFLLFRVLRVDTVCEFTSSTESKHQPAYVCLLRCSGHGQCDPITKECACDPFWTENLIRRYLGDGESNCEWRVLYVILTSFVLMVFILSVSWTFICCCKRRRQTKVRKKTKYTILDNMDEQERVELRPKFSIKHRSTEHNSSLMMSESELDSDQDTIFSRERPVRSRNRLGAQAARNGNAFG